MEGYGPETFGEQMAAVYDSWYGTRLADATPFTASSRAHVPVYAPARGSGG